VPWCSRDRENIRPIQRPFDLGGKLCYEFFVFQPSRGTEVFWKLLDRREGPPGGGKVVAHGAKVLVPLEQLLDLSAARRKKAAGRLQPGFFSTV
jgi:hypothetical protein